MEKEEKRRNRFNRLVDFMNVRNTWYDAPRTFETEFTEMFEVVEIHDGAAVFALHFEEAICSPIVMPESVLALLRPDDLVLATLRLSRGNWYVIFMSHLYEYCDFDQTLERVN